MATAGTDLPPADGKRIQHWLRVLRPLGWWVLLVLAMFGYRTHQRLSEQTHLIFSVSLEGQRLQNDASATLDGQPVRSGDRVPLGPHRFVVSHLKAEPFSTNLFIWYGEHNSGDIRLRRSKGMLHVQASPPAERISITGPEVSMPIRFIDKRPNPRSVWLYAAWQAHPWEREFGKQPDRHGNLFSSTLAGVRVTTPTAPRR